jgi:hypothetical protein
MDPILEFATGAFTVIGVALGCLWLCLKIILKLMERKP